MTSLRHQLSSLILISAIAPLAACFAGEGGSDDGAGGGGGGETTLTGGSEGGGTCEAIPREHPTCTEDCPLTVDVAIACGDQGSPDATVSVALDDDAIAVGLGLWSTHLLTLQAGVLVEAMTFEGEAARVPVATMRDGRFAAAAIDLVFEDGENIGGPVFGEAADDQPFSREELGEDPQVLIDLEVGPDGTPFLFNRFQGTSVTTRRDGVWSTIPLSEGYGLPRFTVSPDGEPVVVDLRGDMEVSGIMAWIGTDEPIVLGTFSDEFLGTGVRVAHPPAADLAVGAAELAVLVQRDGQPADVYLHDGVETAHIALAEARTYVPSCAGSGGESDCPQDTCTEDSVAVQRGGATLARTDDGAVFIVYVLDTIHRVVTYEVDCDDEEEWCGCSAHDAVNESQSTLRVQRLAPGSTTPEDVLSLPIEDFVPGQSDEDGELHTLDARGFGHDVAIALRVIDEAGAPMFRVLRVSGPAD